MYLFECYNLPDFAIETVRLFEHVHCSVVVVRALERFLVVVVHGLVRTVVVVCVLERFVVVVH